MVNFKTTRSILSKTKFISITMGNAMGKYDSADFDAGPDGILCSKCPHCQDKLQQDWRMRYMNNVPRGMMAGPPPYRGYNVESSPPRRRLKIYRPAKKLFRRSGRTQEYSTGPDRNERYFYPEKPGQQRSKHPLKISDSDKVFMNVKFYK